MPSVKLSPSTRIRGRVLVSGTCRILSSRNPRLLVTNGYDALPQCRSQVQLGSSACWRTGSPMKQVLCGLMGGLGVSRLLCGRGRLLATAGVVVHITTTYAGVGESMLCHGGRAEDVPPVNHNWGSQQFTQAIEINGGKFFPI